MHHAMSVCPQSVVTQRLKNIEDLNNIRNSDVMMFIVYSVVKLNAIKDQHQTNLAFLRFVLEGTKGADTRHQTAKSAQLIK